MRLDGKTLTVSLYLLSFSAYLKAAPTSKQATPASSSRSSARGPISLIDPGEVLLHWTAPGDDSLAGLASGYDMRYLPESWGPINTNQEWNLANLCSGEPVPSPSGQLDSMIVAELEPGSGYYFCVRAFDDAGNYSGFSNSPLMVAADGPPPDILPPTLLSPPDNADISDFSPSLDWSDVFGADFYEIQVDNSSNFSSPERSSAPSVSQWTVVPDLATGTWYWRVRAHGGSGYSSWTTPWSFVITILPPFGPPQLLSPPDGAYLGDHSPLLDWGDVDGAIFYQVVVDDDPDFSSLDRYSAVDSSGWTVSPDLPGGDWYWMARTRGSSGFSGWSDVWHFIASDSLPDYVPGDANGSGVLNGNDVTFLLNYLRGGPPPPPPIWRADANGDCIVNGTDVSYLVNFFKGWGQPPVGNDCGPVVARERQPAPDRDSGSR
jgi:hypothetical protein